jgi:catechol 2,3-dioxygenase-like lactoylglutathione lyase family enzyme
MSELEPWVRQPFPNFGPDNEVRAAVTDLGRAKFFYVDKLGCEVLKSSDSEALITGGLLRGKLLLRVACRGKLPPGVKLPVLWTTIFLGGTRELFRDFEFSGVKIVEPFHETESGRCEFTIADPDGNMISFSGPP